MHTNNDEPKPLKRAFTLIELLIVVLIIAVLAAIAVPNFLEAQVRAKVGRAKADLRTIATALESYAADAGHYPLNDGNYNVVPRELTSPISYIGSNRLLDPFSEKELHPQYGELARYYTYAKIVTAGEALQDIQVHHSPPLEAIDSAAQNPGALVKYGKWRLVSNGPDRIYSNQALCQFDPVLWGADIAYDPSNGSISFGNILRLQSDPAPKFAR
jgi:prepilin-type N-terminal cleavage/methylation domain-containing protein